MDKNFTDEQLMIMLKEVYHPRYFSMLVQRHENYILKKCRSYVKDVDEAEDLCQEILIKLFTKIQSFKGEAKFSTWLFAIIHNTCVDHLRKNKRNVREVITGKMADELAEMIEGVDEVPEDLSMMILEELLEDLSQEDKMILLLKYKEKHSLKDIQSTLGLSESAVKMRLARAKGKVNKLYETFLLKKRTSR